MAETHLPHHEEHDPTVHHEDSDVNVRAILWFTAIFVVVAIVIHVGMWFMLKGLRAYENNRPVTPVTEIPLTPDRQIPPQPRLQPFPEPANPANLSESSESRGKQEAPQLEKNFMDPWVLTPAADWREYKAAYDQKVNSYGWIDRNRGIAHIPIDEAKRRLLRQGLSSRSALPAAAGAEAAPVADEAQTSAAANEPRAQDATATAPATAPTAIPAARPAVEPAPARPADPTPASTEPPVTTTQPGNTAVPEPGR